MARGVVVNSTNKFTIAAPPSPAEGKVLSDDGSWVEAGGEVGAHTHPTSDVTGLDDALAAHDSDIAGKADAAHAHAIDDVTGLQTALDGKSDSDHTHEGGGSGLTAAGGPVVLHHPHMAASAVATNLALNAFNAVSDPNFRQMCDLRGFTKVRIQGRIGGALVAATKIRIQYHLGGNPAVVTGDAGWTTLADSAGSHTVNVMFYSAEIAVPAGAQVNDVLIRCGLFSGNGTADPTITTCIMNFYA